MVEALEHDRITAAATATIRFWSFGQIMFQFTVHFGDIRPRASLRELVASSVDV